MAVEPKKIRFVLLGGFLGAGKTTLISELAQRYTALGKRVGIITNDQADNLVDTQNLRSRGFEVGEVAGACFCCSFDDLVATAESLGESELPDLLLAEPVGSCTDLVATVILPLQQLLGDRFELAPFGVLLKPSHGKRILLDEASGRSGFSPQAEYIFRKQLEEADYLMIGRADQLDQQEVDTLKQRLSEVSAGVNVMAVSPKTGQGVDEVMAQIASTEASGRRLLDIDYDTYADGEAELGWVNLTAHLVTHSAMDLDGWVASLVKQIADEISPQGQIAHLKASVLAGDTQAVANVVSNDSQVDVGLLAGRSVEGKVQVIVNARVAMDPTTLEMACRNGLLTLCQAGGVDLGEVSAHSLRPGRPTPTHRVTAKA